MRCSTFDVRRPIPERLHSQVAARCSEPGGKRLSLAFLAACVLFPFTAHGQVEVEISTDRDQFLLYEPLEISVRVTSQTSETLYSKRAAKAKPWLDFFVTTADYDEIQRADKDWSPPSLSLPPGGNKTVAVNLTPCFQIRQAGDYRVQAMVNLGGKKIASRPISFSVVSGVPVWQKEFTAPPAPEDKSRVPRPRVYSLLVQRRGEQTVLYVRIMDPEARVVYCTAPVGALVNFGEPKTHIGTDGDLHVFYQTGTRLFNYTRFSPSGKKLVSRHFSNISSTPMMITGEDHETDIIGGEELTADKETHEIPTAPVAHAPFKDQGTGNREAGDKEQEGRNKEQAGDAGGEKKDEGHQKHQIILEPEF